MLKGPFGDGVWDGSGEMESGESVETLDVAALADAGHTGTELQPMLFVDILDPLFSHILLGSADAAGRFYAGDGGVEGGAGDPERRRHSQPLLVFYYARRPEGTTGGDPEWLGFAAELAGHDLTVVHGLPFERL